MGVSIILNFYDLTLRIQKLISILGNFPRYFVQFTYCPFNSVIGSESSLGFRLSLLLVVGRSVIIF